MRHTYVVAMILSATLMGQALAAPDVITVEDQLALAVPEGSGLRFAHVAEPFQSAVFDGRFTLSGTYYYGRMSTDDGDASIGLYFMPDRSDAARLPHWQDRGPVKELRFHNPDSFVAAVVPKHLAQAVEGGRRASVQGRAQLVAEGFEAVVVCDAAIYLTRFHALTQPSKLFAAKGTQTRLSC